MGTTRIRGSGQDAGTVSSGGPAAREDDAAARAGGTGGRGPAGFPAVLREVLRQVPDSAREGFVRSVTGPADRLDTGLWGRGPGPAARRQAGLENLARQYRARRAVLEACVTRHQAADLLGVSEQAVLDRVGAGDLIGLRQGREWRLPAWQFDPDAERGFVPGLARLRRVFPGGPVSLTEWATTGNADLGGASPAAALTAGRVEQVLAAATATTSAGW